MRLEEWGADYPTAEARIASLPPAVLTRWAADNLKFVWSHSRLDERPFAMMLVARTLWEFMRDDPFPMPSPEDGLGGKLFDIGTDGAALIAVIAGHGATCSSTCSAR